MVENYEEGRFEISVYDKDGNLKYYDKCSNPIVTGKVENVLRDKGYFNDPPHGDPGLGVIGNVAYSLYVIFVFAIVGVELFILVWIICQMLGIV